MTTIEELEHIKHYCGCKINGKTCERPVTTHIPLPNNQGDIYCCDYHVGVIAAAIAEAKQKEQP